MSCNVNSWTGIAVVLWEVGSQESGCRSASSSNFGCQAIARFLQRLCRATQNFVCLCFLGRPFRRWFLNSRSSCLRVACRDGFKFYFCWDAQTSGLGPCFQFACRAFVNSFLLEAVFRIICLFCFCQLSFHWRRNPPQITLASKGVTLPFQVPSESNP